MGIHYEGYASFWLCKVNSKKDLEEYVEIDYEKDEEEIPFPLGCDFNISWYDEDSLEISYHPDLNGWDLLKGHSFMEDLLPDLIEKFQGEMEDKFNSVIIFYDLSYDGGIKEIENEYGYFKYIGTFKWSRQY